MISSNPALHESSFWSRVLGRDVHYLCTKSATIIAYTSPECKGWWENTWSTLSEKYSTLRYYQGKGYRFVSMEVSMHVRRTGAGYQFAYEYIIRICPQEAV